MSSLSAWILASRPKTLIAAIAPVWIGFALASHEETFSPIWIFPILFATILIQIGTNVANDYYDWKKGADTNERIGPQRVTQSGLLLPHQVKLGFILLFSVAILIGFPLALRGGWSIVAIGLTSVACGILYTAGPYAFAYRGWSELFVILYFGIIAVTGTEYLLTLSWNWNSIWAGVPIGLLATALLIINNVRDIQTDKKIGKLTLPARYGSSFGLFEYSVCIILAVLMSISFIYRSYEWFSLVSLIPLVPYAYILIRQAYQSRSNEEYIHVLVFTAKYQFLFGVLFGVAILLGIQ